MLRGQRIDIWHDFMGINGVTWPFALKFAVHCSGVGIWDWCLRDGLG